MAQGLLPQRPRETGLGKGWLLCPWRIYCQVKVGSTSVATNYFFSPPLSLAEESLQHSWQQDWGFWVPNASLIDASNCIKMAGAFLSAFNADLPCHLSISTYITVSGGPNINPPGVLIILQWQCHIKSEKWKPNQCLCVCVWWPRLSPEQPGHHFCPLKEKDQEPIPSSGCVR